MSQEPRGLLIDITRCIGCRSCMEECMKVHGFPGDPADVEQLSATSYTVLVEKDGVFARKMCMHCVNPSCASVCPVSALKKTPLGPVVYDSRVCLGCRYCIQACPFGVPRYEWNKAVPAVAKCDGCLDRLQRGEPPACVSACFSKAAIAGTRKELLEEAHRRIRENKDKYYPHVYGESEVGGTSVLFLSPVPFSAFGFKEDLGTTALPLLTQAALARVPGIVVVGGSLLLGIWWITRRREMVAREEAAERDALAKTAGAEGGLKQFADRVLGRQPESVAASAGGVGHGNG